MHPWAEKAQRALDELKYHNEGERRMLAHVIACDCEPYHTVKGFIEKALAREDGWKPPYYAPAKPETIVDCLALRWEVEIVHRFLLEWMAYDGWEPGARRAIETIKAACWMQPPAEVVKLWDHLAQHEHDRYSRERRGEDKYLLTMFNEGCRIVGQLAAAHDLMGAPWHWDRPPPAGEYTRRAGEMLEVMGLMEEGGWID